MLTWHVNRVERFYDQGTADVANARASKAARRAIHPEYADLARRKIDALIAAPALRDLALIPENMLELLKGDRAGQYSIRINRQYRMCFLWTEHGARRIKIAHYH
ncbi:MAG: type II toxin-antitoxin system RelE/ParE family toxin [Candidatus Eremiobacteraeota bacterium]|nr:type II toxin-antitoxin system RelE/ParE family toxin [Candidatus Eremiobacteraeota bacterium]